MKSVRISIDTVNTAISSLKASKANIESQINLLKHNSSSPKDHLFDDEDTSRKIMLLEYELSCIENALAEAESVFQQTIKEQRRDEKEQGVSRAEYLFRKRMGAKDEKKQDVSRPEYSFNDMKDGETDNTRSFLKSFNELEDELLKGLKF